MVANVETLVNIGQDAPVTHKYLTVAGAVRTPVTLRVPVGISIGEVIEAAGGATDSDFGALLGGVMMGRLAPNLDEPVTKTLGGIVVLPVSHPMIAWYQEGLEADRAIAKSACDQCRFCTELCPRYLLGHPIQPHRAMAAVGFTGPKIAVDRRYSFLLRVQPVQPVRLPGEPRSEERVRRRQSRWRAS